MVASLYLLFLAPILLAPWLYRRYNDRLHKPILITKDHLVLGYHHRHINYVLTLKGNVLTQKWVINQKDMNKRSASLKPNDRRIEKKVARDDVEKLNREGIKGTHVNEKYSGFVQYKLGESNGYSFSIKDFNRFKELWERCRLKNAINQIEAPFSLIQANRAYFRRDLYYAIEGISNAELVEIMELILKKNDYTSKGLNINALSPFEAFFKYIVETKNNLVPHDFGDHAFEFQLNDFKGKPKSWTPKHEQILSKEKGVHIGDGLRFPEKGHFLTIGKTRSGKGTNFIIPHLLQPEKFDGSQVIVDIKGDLTAVTAKYLKDAGKKVIIIDPWGRQKQIKATHSIEPSSYNPLDFLDKNHPEFVDDCMELGNSIVAFDSQDKQDGHWVDRARNWVSDYLYYMVKSDDIATEDITLRKLRSLFSLNEDKKFELYADMQASGDPNLIDTGAHLTDMFNNSDREAQGILSSVLRAIDFFKSPIIEKATSHSDFDVNDIINGDYVVFINIPPDKLPTHYRWLRLILGSIIRAVLRQPPKKRTLMIIDEFARLARFSLIEHMMGMAAGYNLSFWIIAQGIDQIRTEYPNSWENFVNNVAVTTWIGLDGVDNPEYLSKLLGTRHVMYKTDNTVLQEIRTGKVTPAERYEIRSQTEAQIRLAEFYYVLVSGLEPIVREKSPYYKNHLAERAAPDPYNS